MGSILAVDEMPIMEARSASVSVCALGGLMFYTRDRGRAAFEKDVEAMFNPN
jgi:hypothetical protein